MGSVKFQRRNQKWQPCVEVFDDCELAYPQGLDTVEQVNYTTDGTYPSGIQCGDNILTFVIDVNDETPPEVPSGFTEIFSSTGNGSGVRQAFKVANDNEPIGDSIGWSTAENFTGWVITIVIRGGEFTSGVVNESEAFTDALNHQAPSVAATQDDSLVYVLTYEEDNGSVTGTAGYSTLLDEPDIKVFRKTAEVEEGIFQPTIAVNDAAGGDKRVWTFAIAPEVLSKCCASHVCYLCLEFTCEGDYYTGTATWNGEKYVGELSVGIDEIEFVGEWGREAGECKFFVFLDGVLAHTFDRCSADNSYGVQCRDPEGTFEYEHLRLDGYTCTGIFEFSKRDDKRLRKRFKQEDGEPSECSDPFCTILDKQVKCTCASLCVHGSIDDYSDADEDCIIVGTIPWVDTDDCELGTLTPRWAGPAYCAAFDLNQEIYLDIYLSRNEYGECVLKGTAIFYEDGVTKTLDEYILDPTPGNLFAEWSVTISANKTATFSLTCELCGECGEISVNCCDDPLPRTLWAVLEAEPPIPMTGADDCSCLDGDYQMVYQDGGQSIGSGFAGWMSQEIAWPCPSSGIDIEYFVVELYCLVDVWTFAITLYSADGSIYLDSVKNNPAGTCSPVNLDFGCENLVTGLCIPGIVPNDICVTVVE